MSPLEALLAEQWPDGRFGGPRPAAPDLTPRGNCAWCNRQWAINADGHLRAHWIPGDADRTPCLGSGRRPVAIQRTIRTSPAAAARHQAALLAALRTRKARP
ncbi:hypothetical protein [Streptomyces sp. NBC_01565]|uniref:hypothetical protein n=1 Tax=Streptomyces sp. NBC_01565 TaxID=2975881 RepID=UPI002256A67D|nr:hypothetical protein [Streptomyces sp. NBC_01565]MCX4543819.1 hypothetical protein [Streptomyces sp. NBC_01565]